MRQGCHLELFLHILRSSSLKWMSSLFRDKKAVPREIQSFKQSDLGRKGQSLNLKTCQLISRPLPCTVLKKLKHPTCIWKIFVHRKHCWRSWVRKNRGCSKFMGKLRRAWVFYTIFSGYYRKYLIYILTHLEDETENVSG